MYTVLLDAHAVQSDLETVLVAEVRFIKSGWRLLTPFPDETTNISP